MNDNELPSEIDELLSAELDGELADAAADLGITEAEARARLASTPGIEQRRAALSRARDALTAAPELDELVAARLRAKAVRAAAGERSRDDDSRRARRRDRWLAVAGVAAAAAVVLGLVATVGHNGTGSKSLARGVTPTANPAQANAGAAAPTSSGFGTAADAAKLVQQVVRRLESSRAFTSEKQAATPSADSARAPQLACADTAARVAGTGAAPVATGNATLAGRPVWVAVYGRAGAYQVVVLSQDCRGLVTYDTVR